MVFCEVSEFGRYRSGSLTPLSTEQVRRFLQILKRLDRLEAALETSRTHLDLLLAGTPSGFRVKS
jgi:hypothetical protein